MKLINHVLKIRSLVQQAIDNRFAKMGIKETELVPVESLPQDLIPKREKLEDILNNHLSELQDYSKARQETINECTFTLFNKIAAIKVMEEKELFPEVIKRRPENGNKSFAHNLWLEENPEEKSAERQGLKHFLQAKFNELGESFSLYNENYPYSLMPTADELYNILEAFNEVEDDPECGADVWKGDDILGWLYEDFNATEKEVLKNSDEKTEYDKVSLQSQVYTPRWVVKFLVDNTLGKMYLEMFPDSDIVKPDENGNLKYKIANAPASRKREIKKMEEIRVIDPACGSGNFLIYTFDLLYDMYVNQIEQYGAEYSRRDIPRLILENNIYGVDLDERAVQLSQIALFIKAREKGGRRAKNPSHTNVVSTHFFLPDYSEVESVFISSGEWDSKQQETIKKIWSDLQNAYKFGSLVRVEEVLNGLSLKEDEGLLFANEVTEGLFSFKRRVSEVLRDQVRAYCEKNASEYALTKAEDAMTFLNVLSMPFDVIVANPPYTYSRDFGKDLKCFVNDNYVNSYNVSTNLYSCFIKRGLELLNQHGYFGIIHPKTFMCISKFKETRSLILNQSKIDIFVDWGFLGIFPQNVRVDSAFYTLKKDSSLTNMQSTFIKLDDIYEGIRYDEFMSQYNGLLKGDVANRVYHIEQKKFLKIKSSPFIYWISDEFRNKFSSRTLAEEFDICNGISSGGNNERFYRFFWEIDKNKIMSETNTKNYKWVTINKGGEANKWYGNQWLVFDWEDNGHTLKALKDKFPSIRYGYEEYYYKEGLAFNGSGKKLAVRIQPPYCLFERAGKAIYSKRECDYYKLMGILNSKLCSYIMSALNSTISFQSGDLERMPYIEIEDCTLSTLSKQNTEIKKYLSQYSIFEPLFSTSPLKPKGINVNDGLREYLDFENSLNTIVLLNESLIDLIVFNGYSLSEEDRAMVIEKEGIPLAILPVTKDALNAFYHYIEEIDTYKLSEDVKQLLEKAIVDVVPVIDVNEFSSLYQNNNDWDKFCHSINMNPVEIWFQYHNSTVIPDQRAQKISFELLTDVINCILLKDNDGIIPICDNTGEEQLAIRIEEEFYNRGYSPLQFKQCTQLLGHELQKYLLEYYFQQLSDATNYFDHMPRTPFIWHICSGPHHALDLLVSIYKFDRNSLFRIKSYYAANKEGALKDRLSSIASSGNESQFESNQIKEQLNELRSFVKKIDTLLADGYDAVLDSGVGRNIAPLQRIGILSYNVLTDDQLKTYLAATW